MEVSDQLYAHVALPPETAFLVTYGQEAGQASQLVWMWGQRDNFLLLPGIKPVTPVNMMAHVCILPEAENIYESDRQDSNPK